MLYTAAMTTTVRVFMAWLCIFLCLLATEANAQWREKAVRDYIAWLVEQDVSIIYSSDLVGRDLQITNEPRSQDRVEVLREILAPHQLILTTGPGDSLLIVRDPAATMHVTIVTRDASNGMPVRAARIEIDGHSAGVSSAGGALLLPDLEQGEHRLVVVAEGYTPSGEIKFNVAAGQSPRIEIRIEPAVEELTEIIVASSVYSLDYNTAGSHTFLDRELTTRLPDIGNDAVRSVQRLPGIAAGGVSTKSNVRGGADNEQLFLYDGLRLYEPYHLKDFHSVSTIVDQNAVAGIDFYSAGYQVRHGDRMSGVIDMSMRERPSDMVTELALSFFNASVLSMGRFGGDENGDWLVTARRGNLDIVADAVNSAYGSPQYEDTMLHLGWQLSDRTYVSGNLLYSYDKISIAEIDGSEQANAKYQNLVAWFKAQTEWTSDLRSTTILSMTEIDNERSGVTNIPDVVSGDVVDARDFRALTVNQAWTWDATDAWLVTSGFEIKRLESRYDYASTLNIASPFDQILDNQALRTRNIQVTPRGGQFAAYGELRWRPFDKLILDAGARWDQQTYTTADNDDQSSLRFNLLYFLTERTEIRLAAGRFYQAQEINELQVNDGVSSFAAAQRATHLVASIAHQLQSGIDIRLEYYQKKYRSLMPRYENVFDSLVLIPELQIDRIEIDAPAALSKGAELMVSGDNTSGNIFWWLSYTWSTTEDFVAEGHVKRSWDQTDSIKAGVNWDWKKWNFSVAANIHSGWPRTDLLVEEVGNPDGSTSLVATTTPRNSRRFPTFHTVDARASRRFDVSRGDLTVFLEITNIYNHTNACCTKYRLQTDLDGTQSLSANQGNWLPLIPSLGVMWQF